MPCFDNEISWNGNPLASNHARASRLDFEEPDVYNLIIQSPLAETTVYFYRFLANTTYMLVANNIHWLILIHPGHFFIILMIT